MTRSHGKIGLSSPSAIQEIVAALNATPDHSTHSITHALNHEVSLADVSPWIRFDVANYARNLVATGPNWELRLLCWRPGQSTSLHGHGTSVGGIRVLRGNAQEIVVGERDRKWGPGSVIIEVGASHIHQVSNPGPDALLSLHAYSPPLPVDAPSSPLGDSVVIVGGGFAGVATAWHLLRKGSSSLRVTIVERGPWLGRGVAYGVEDPLFRLNVPASRMSLDPDHPDDFVRWSGAESAPDAFLSREAYGRYVEARLREAVCGSSGKLRIVRADATAIEPGAVQVSDGRRLTADAVILATGIAPRVSPTWLAVDSRIVDAWDECALPTLPETGRLLILGAGLSAVDMVALLKARNFRGTVTILSRRGLLPRPHLEPWAPATPVSAELVKSAPRELRELLRWARRNIEERSRGDVPWQQALDSFRPHITLLWRRLSPADRARFTRLVRPYWDVLRHRAPVDSLASIESWRRQGRLEVQAGRVISCVPRPEALDVVVQDRRGVRRHERFDAVVRCIGPALDRSELRDPLVASLLEGGIAQADPARLGIVTDENGRVVGPDNRPLDWLYGLGAVRRASDWETTSVPDIAKHARDVARQVMAGFGQPVERRQLG